MLLSRNYTLPNDPIFSRLVKQLKKCDQRVILDDRNRGLEVSYHQLLHGTVRLREKLREVLDRNDLARPGTFFIAVLAPNSYEFIISLLAVLAIGGVVVPIPTGALPAEAAYIIEQCSAKYLLVSPDQVSLADQIQAEVKAAVLTVDNAFHVSPNDIFPVTSSSLDQALAVSEDCPSVLFFTSGTTGPPKGVLHARQFLNDYALSATPSSTDELCLIPRGAFWAVYFTQQFRMLCMGIRVEIQDFGRHYDLIWERLREQNGTRIVLSPTFWYGMMEHFQRHISKLPEATVREYVEGVRCLRDACVTGAMPANHLKMFWQELRGGQPLRVQYGSTETQEISICDPQSSESSEVECPLGFSYDASADIIMAQPDLGKPLPGVIIKLSQGEEGELLVKSRSLFLRYLNLPDETAARFDSEGFFKTGDIVRREKGRYIFQGRANMDLFKFYTYKVPRTTVESHLTALHYVAEGYIMPVSDPQCDTRTAALVRICAGVGQIDLHTIRNDLSKRLPAYQLPTLLRILRDHEEVPRTWSGKTAMREAIETFFAQSSNLRAYGNDTEVMDVSEFMRTKTARVWDRAGMR